LFLSVILVDETFVLDPAVAGHGTKMVQVRETHGLGGSSAHKRLSELRDMGYIKEVYKAKCPLTGQRVIWWDVTAKRPKTPVRKKR
jgi:hypothetical protein